jgi:hypothetical protein
MFQGAGVCQPAILVALPSGLQSHTNQKRKVLTEFCLGIYILGITIYF